MSTKQKIEKMVAELYEFAESDALILREFIKKQKLSYEQFTKYLLNSPELKEAYEYARLCIGIKREEFALRNKLNTKIISDTMPLYDDERKLWEETKLKLSKVEQKIGADIIKAIVEQVT
jgi:hypothetical protein